MSLQQVKNLVGWYFENSLGVVLVNWGSVWGGDKCGKLYGVETTQAGGVSGFELYFFTRLGVTTKFCQGHRAVMKGLKQILQQITEVSCVSKWHASMLPFSASDFHSV